MTARRLLSDLSRRVLPINSDRRMIGRVVKELVSSPGRFLARVNRRNIANFIFYRRQTFDCPVCGKRTTPLYDFPDLWMRREHRVPELRETLQCRQCFASMRARCLAAAFLDEVNQRNGIGCRSIAALATTGLGTLRVLDTDNFSALSRLLREQPGYVRCSYRPDMPWGETSDPGLHNIDLERIDFPDASFDLVLTSDVMEHVRNDKLAHAEIARVLRPGGSYIFTVPFDGNEQATITLIDTSGPEDVFLAPPQYHGDPLSDGILAYRIFGRNLLSQLQELGLTCRHLCLDRPENLILAGDVFVATRSHR